MAEQIRVQVYEGLYRSQSEDFFEADATEAARHGWFPTDRSWTGTRLTVAYAYRTRSRSGRARRAGGRQRTLPTWMRAVYWTVVLGTVTAAILLLIAVVMTLGFDRGAL